MADNDTGRLEAFSDGVFAIAVTLLALDLKVPSLPPGAAPSRLAVALAAEWPSYLGFVVSFGTVLVMWINHHWLMRIIGRVDQTFLLLNGLLLLLITAVPFPTAVLSAYLDRPAAWVAALVWAAYFELVGLAFNVLWRYSYHGRRLIDPAAPERLVTSIHSRYRWGPFYYLVPIALAPIFVPASVAANIALAVLYALPHPVAPEPESAEPTTPPSA